ncbi:MAG: hypothetical protein KDD35_08665, partial [Bdellovibrionales bacterium]|nr:hypothetical protein [Bdellovibrionales bacterium]
MKNLKLFVFSSVFYLILTTSQESFASSEDRQTPTRSTAQSCLKSLSPDLTGVYVAQVKNEGKADFSLPRSIVKLQKLGLGAYRIWNWFPYNLEGETRVFEKGVRSSKQVFSGGMVMGVRNSKGGIDEHMASIVTQQEEGRLQFLYPLLHFSDEFHADYFLGTNGRFEVQFDIDPDRDVVEYVPLGEFKQNELISLLSKLAELGPKPSQDVLFMVMDVENIENEASLVIANKKYEDYLEWKSIFEQNPDLQAGLGIPLSVSFLTDDFFRLPFDMDEGIIVKRFSIKLKGDNMPSEIARFLGDLLSDQKNAENESLFIVINEVDEKNSIIVATLEKPAIMKLLEKYHSYIES